MGANHDLTPEQSPDALDVDWQNRPSSLPPIRAPTAASLGMGWKILWCSSPTR